MQEEDKRTALQRLGHIQTYADQIDDEFLKEPILKHAEWLKATIEKEPSERAIPVELDDAKYRRTLHYASAAGSTPAEFIINSMEYPFEVAKALCSAVNVDYDQAVIEASRKLDAALQKDYGKVIRDKAAVSFVPSDKGDGFYVKANDKHIGMITPAVVAMDNGKPHLGWRASSPFNDFLTTNMHEAADWLQLQPRREDT